MAYIQQVPDEEKNKFAPTGQTTPNPLPPQTSGSAGTTAQGGGAAPGVGTSTQFGSNAAKLSDYLKANESQVQDFGNKVAGNLTQGYNDTMNTINQGFGNFNQSVNQGWSQPNQDKINQAASNPVGFASDPNNVKDFQSWYNNQYTGPQSFETSEPYQNINNSVGKAVENSNLTGSFSGLGSYLNNFMGTGSNTPGMNTLDTALLQRNPNASNTIKSAAAPYKGLNDYLGTKTQEGNQNIASAKNQANQSRESLQNQFTGEGGVIPNFQNELNQKLTDARGGASGEQETIKRLLTGLDSTAAGRFNDKKILQDMGMTKDQLKEMGWTEDQLRNTYGNLKDLGGNNYYNNDNSSLLNYATYQNPESAMNMENIASADDYAKAQAFQQLTGNPSSFNTQNPGVAGTANNMDLVDYNTTGAMQDRSGLLNSYDKQIIDRFSSGDPKKWLDNHKYLVDNYLTTGQMSPGLQSAFSGGINQSLSGSEQPYVNAFIDSLIRGKYYTPPEGVARPGVNKPPPVTPPPTGPGRPFIPLPVGGGQTSTGQTRYPLGLV